jgi:hypothetical protein|tara:strand:+ start:706 stop:1053 length:348 start_codon:yes stop_codon:yes gene_type:complete
MPKEIKEEIILEPRCMPSHGSKERRMQAAVTNRGHLIPCCWIDQTSVLNHPTMEKMLKVSKISENNSIKDILLTEEWRDFAQNLANRNFEKIMPVCVTHCKKREGLNRHKIETVT